MTSAIVYTEFGGPEVLQLIEIPDPVPGEDEVAIRVEAVGVNPVDGKLRSGLRASAPLDGQRRVGGDGAGIVTTVGAGVDGFRPGDAVVFGGAPGAYATDVVVPAARVHVRPPQVSAAVGAGLAIPIGTAYQALRSLGVGPGDTLLVHGGSGAVGQAAVQFAVLWGATVLATTSERRAERIRALGATPIVYGEGLRDRVSAAAPQGITVALDAAGTDEALQSSLDLVEGHDRIATIVRGRDAASFGIRAFGGGGPLPLTPQQQEWRHEAVPVALALLAVGRFTIELGPQFPLADAAEAHRLVEAGAEGKVTLVP